MLLFLSSGWMKRNDFILSFVCGKQVIVASSGDLPYFSDEKCLFQPMMMTMY